MNKKIFLRFLNYMKPYWLYISVSLIFTLIVNLFALFQPVLIRIILDDVIIPDNPSFHMLNMVVLGFVGLLLGKGIFTYLQGYMLPCGVNKAIRDIRDDIFRHIQFLPLKSFQKFRTGDLMVRITNDAENLSNAFGLGMVNFINDIAVLVGALYFMFTKNIYMTILVITVSPIIALAVNKFAKYVETAVQRNQKQMAVIYNTIEESITGIKVIKSFTGEDREIENFKNQNESLFAHIMKVIQFKVTQIPVVEIVGGVGMGVALWYGGLQIINQEFTVGQIFEVWGYMIMATNPLNRLGQTYSTIKGSLISAQRIFEVMDTPEEEENEEKEKMPEIRGDVSFDGVTFGYNEGQKVLDGLSFRVKAGEVIALVGHSGSGKTTTVSLLSRFYKPEAGRILVDGIDIAGVNLRSYRKQLAMVPQETILFTGTIRSNIAYGRPQASEEEIIAAAKAANAHDFIMQMPGGYDTAVGEKGSTLSGGQRQRIAIARALLLNPRILILDEATSSVDAISEELIQQSLEKAFKDRTTFIVAHRVSTIKKAHKIFVFDRGEIVECGNHESLMAANGLYSTLYESFFKESPNREQEAAETQKETAD